MEKVKEEMKKIICMELCGIDPVECPYKSIKDECGNSCNHIAKALHDAGFRKVEIDEKEFDKYISMGISCSRDTDTKCKYCDKQIDNVKMFLLKYKDNWLK